jgi:hypothetical protein
MKVQSRRELHDESGSIATSPLPLLNIRYVP